MKKILVTGASGFLGKSCLPLLLEAGYTVHAVTSGNAKYAIDNVKNLCWHQVDLLNDELKIKTLMEKVQPTHLLHLAWCRTIPGQYWNNTDNFRWVEASLRLFRLFARAEGQRIVTAGTCAEYDWSNGICSETETPLIPTSVYGTCKHALQILQESFCKQANIRSAWGRLFFLYGPNEYPQRLVASIIRALLRDEIATCSTGQQLRDFLHVNDAASAFLALLESDIASSVNISSGQPVAVKDVAFKIGELLHRCDLIQLDAAMTRADEPPLVTADVRRLQSIGWQPQFDLESGLQDAIEWWRQREGESI